MTNTKYVLTFAVNHKSQGRVQLRSDRSLVNLTIADAQAVVEQTLTSYTYVVVKSPSEAEKVLGHLQDEHAETRFVACSPFDGLMNVCSGKLMVYNKKYNWLEYCLNGGTAAINDQIHAALFGNVATVPVVTPEAEPLGECCPHCANATKASKRNKRYVKPTIHMKRTHKVRVEASENRYTAFAADGSSQVFSTLREAMEWSRRARPSYDDMVHIRSQ